MPSVEARSLKGAPQGHALAIPRKMELFWKCLKAINALAYLAITSMLMKKVLCAFFYMENDAEIFPAHYTWKVAEKGIKMASMMNKLEMINSCEIILEK